MKKIIYLLLICHSISCNQKSDPIEILNKTKLTKPVTYSMAQSTSDWAAGEGTESYTLIISQKDFGKIVNDIKDKPFFQHLDTAKRPIYAFDMNTDLKKKNETACWFDNKYFYQIFDPNPGITITIVLEKDSMMYINYADL